MTKTVPAIGIGRDSHKVVVAGEELAVLDMEIETDLYGSPSFKTPVSDDIIAAMGPPYSLSWSVEMNRVAPFTDDQYPMSMPQAIANLGFRAENEDTLTPSRSGEVTGIYMRHLHVQEEARQQGYGQLLWDVYLAVVAYGGYRAAGGIGSTETGATVAFLKSQGVPEADISPGRKTPGGGAGTVGWSTPAANLTAAAPITETTVEVPDG